MVRDPAGFDLAIFGPKMIGEWLIDLGLITQRQIDQVIGLQADHPGLRVGELLVTKGCVTREELEQTLEVQKMLRGDQALSELPVSPRVLSVVPEAFALANKVLPLAQVGLRLLVGVPQGIPTEALDELAVRTGLIMIPLTLPQDQLTGALERLYDRRIRTSPAVAPHVPQMPAPPHSNAALRALARHASAESGTEPAVRELVGSILEEAIRLQATDVHVCPEEACLEVRFRLDGVLHKQLELPKRLESAIASYLRQQAGQTHEAQGPLCQALDLTVGDMRVAGWLSCLPTARGERWKIRLLPRAVGPQELDILPMDPADLAAYNQLLQARQGMILLVGPKRHNRTNQLYSTLRFLDRVSNNMMLLDDAQAMPIPGVTSLMTFGPHGLTPETAIDLALRQDADILLVNELETQAQLEAALRASLEGILVVGCMAAPDVSGALSRLESLGVSPALLAANLKGVVARVLLRRNCPHCAVEYEADAIERAYLGSPSHEPPTLVRGLGCDHCHQTGYAGQVGIYEIMTVTAPIKRMLADPRHTAWHFGEVPYVTLAEDARRKVELGYTRHAEVLRVIGEGPRKRGSTGPLQAFENLHHPAFER